MMAKAFRILGIILGILTLMISSLVAFAFIQSEARLNKVYNKPNDALAIPTDVDVVASGKHIFQFRGCQSCHGDQLEGKVYLSDPAIGEVITANLTSGEGGLGAQYSDQDWINAIRYGIRKDGRPLLFMPSTEFYTMSDGDLAAVIAYIKSVPAVDHTQNPSQLSLLGRVLMTFIKELTFIPTELVPVGETRPTAPAKEANAAYGEYLTYSCKVCHGMGMSGGKIPGFPSDWPIAPNLTMGEGSRLPQMGYEGFANVLRTGMTADGHLISPKYMPWTSYKFMDETEMRATWEYLVSLPPTASGAR